MKLDQLTLEVRPRTPWEAMDLAIRLIMTHWRLLLSSWMVTVFPLFLVINLILLKDYYVWAFLIVWFLKPLYDRIPLFVLSRVIFAEKTTYIDVLNALPGLLKTSVLSSLTLYRLDPGRAFKLPVIQLEGLKGKRKKQRMNTLNRGNNKEILFFVLCFHLESFVYLGLLGLLLLMLPSQIAQQGAETLFLNTEPGLMVNAVSMGFYFIVMMLVETLYVAGGFILYLNRRIILEGWDIELAFRKLSIRQAQVKPHLQNLSALVITTMVFLVANTLPAEVQAAANNESRAYENILPPVSQPPLAAQASSQIIQEVMDDPIFNRFKETETLEYNGKKAKNDDVNDEISQLADFFETIGKPLAFIFEAALWILVLILVFLLVKYRERLLLGFKTRSAPTIATIPETLFGLDVREESLPDNVAEEALQLYLKQQYRLAMALLYRATLAYLAKNYHLDLKKGATEGDCLFLVTEKLSLPSEAEERYFIELTKAWQLTAYAHRIVSEEDMRQLCYNWSRYYEAQPDDDARQQVKNDE